MCDQIKKIFNPEFRKKNQMQEFTEFRRKKSKMAQKKARSFKNSSYL